MTEWYQKFDNVENFELNLEEKASCEKAVEGCDYVFNLALSKTIKLCVCYLF